MPGCSPFRVAYQGDPDILFEKAMKMANANGVTVTGDKTGGRFSATAPIGGRIAGAFKVTDGAVEITITDKPFMLPCAMIESLVRQAVK